MQQKQRNKMEKGNFIMLKEDELKQFVEEVTKEICAKCGHRDDSPKYESEWLTRKEVCEILHITYSTLWRKEKEGIITKYKMGRRNLYSKKSIYALFMLSVETADKNE